MLSYLRPEGLDFLFDAFALALSVFIDLAQQLRCHELVVVQIPDREREATLVQQTRQHFVWHSAIRKEQQ